MVRIGLQRVLVPDLRELVVAEFAVGIADQIGDVRMIVAAEEDACAESTPVCRSGVIKDRKKLSRMLFQNPASAGRCASLFIIALRCSRILTGRLDQPVADWKYKP